MASYDSIAEFYDLDFPSSFPDELEFWKQILDFYDSPALELGCGTGRVTIPLAQAGHLLTGLELSDAMLAMAERNRAELPISVQNRLEFVQGDMTQFELRTQFRVIFIPFNSFVMLLDRTQQESCLHCVRNHLSKNGAFIFTLPGPKRSSDETRRQELCWIKPHPLGQQVVAKFEKSSLDRVKLVRTIEQTYRVYTCDGDVREVHAVHRYRVLFQPEIELLLDKNSLIIERMYGGYDKRPFDAESPERIFVVKRQSNGV